MNESLNQLCAQNQDAEAYFSSLPIHIQELLQQSGMKMTSVQELKHCAEQLTQPK